MKVAGKLALAIVLAILGVMAVHAWLELRREVTLYDADVKKNGRYGRALRGSITELRTTASDEEAMKVVEATDEAVPEVSITWRWMDVPPNNPLAIERPPGMPPSMLAPLDQPNASAQIVQYRDDVALQRFTWVPVYVDGRRPAVIQVKETLIQQRQYIETTHRRLLVTTLFTALACALAVLAVGWWFIGRPLRRLQERTRAVADGDLSPSLAIRQRDEIGSFAVEFNAMCRRLDETRKRLAEETEARITAMEQMRHTDRLTTMGRLAAGVAHELGTPLNVITGRAEMIAAGEANAAEVATSGRVILEQAGHMTGLIRQLLNFARRQGPRFGAISLRAVATATIDMLRPFAVKRRVEITVVAPHDDPLLISADQSQIQQAITNVVMNGLESMSAGGRLAVTLDTCRGRRPNDHEAVDDDYARIIVEDQGEGIAAENVPRIFEPFFTTKGIGEGTGLGLSVAYGIVEEHRGWIDVDSAPGRGSRFTIWIRRGAVEQTGVGVAS
jgi:signal transduction histidine kinase